MKSYSMTLVSVFFYLILYLCYSSHLLCVVVGCSLSSLFGILLCDYTTVLFTHSTLNGHLVSFQFGGVPVVLLATFLWLCLEAQVHTRNVGAQS